MPEQDNNKERRLAGESTETSSSDASIAKRLRSIIAEIEGTTGKIVDQQSSPIVTIPREDVLGPKLIGAQATGISKTDSVQDHQLRRINPLKSKPTDSALGGSLRQERLEKKAA